MHEIAQSNDVVPESRPYLLIGAGDMGRNYLKNLIRLGEASENEISVVDINLEKAQALKDDFPGISIGNVYPEEPAERTFVLSNTPAHLQNLEDLAALGTPAHSVLVEKPLITAEQLSSSKERVRKIVNQFANSYTAYLIEFSPAVEDLIGFMKENDLVVIQGRGNWEKNRVGNSRPSAGDLEDEMTHQLSALMTLSGVNQKIHSTGVSAKLQSLNFVNEEAQAALAAQDSSIPLRPNSATSLNIEIISDRAEQPIDLFMHSSFTSPQQERAIQVVLSDGSGNPQYGARIIFDDPQIKGDKLEVIDYSNKSEPVLAKEYSDADKLGRQAKAFLNATAVGEALIEKHEALRTFPDGLQMVAMSLAAIKSNDQRCKIIELDQEL